MLTFSWTTPTPPPPNPPSTNPLNVHLPSFCWVKGVACPKAYYLSMLPLNEWAGVVFAYQRAPICPSPYWFHGRTPGPTNPLFVHFATLCADRPLRAPPPAPPVPRTHYLSKYPLFLRNLSKSGQRGRFANSDAKVLRSALAFGGAYRGGPRPPL